MKILLICAGGLSTSMLVKKMQKYAVEKGIPLEAIVAKGLGDYEDVYQQFDTILLGPQVSYQKDVIAGITKKPLAVIASYDYALGNAESIFKQVDRLLKQ